MSINKYINETKAEMKHVTWPTRKQTITYAVLVVIISLLVSFYLGFFDYIFTIMIKSFIPGLN